MLDAFIIEELKRRERERQQQERPRPALEVPLPSHDDEAEEDRRSEEKNDRPQRGVIVIDL
jgi:hypothetical protein